MGSGSGRDGTGNKEIFWDLLYQLLLSTTATKTQRSVCAAWDTDQRDAMPSLSSDTSRRHCITLSHTHTMQAFVFQMASGEVHHQQCRQIQKKNNSVLCFCQNKSLDLEENALRTVFFWKRRAGGGWDGEGGLIWLNSNTALRSESV